LEGPQPEGLLKRLGRRGGVYLGKGFSRPIKENADPDGP